MSCGFTNDPAHDPGARRFGRGTDGAALVEFGLVLPVMLLLFSVTIEGARLMWSYQGAIAGVRDATRYVGAVPLFPASITIYDVVPVVACKPGTYHLAYTPVATVTADMTITWPFSGIFGLFGGVLPVKRLQVADTGRIFGA